MGKDTAICFGSYKISAPDGWQSYKWNTGETTKTITVSKAGLYYVLTGNTGFSCPAGYGYITIGDKAIKLDLGKDTTLCKGATYLLQVNNDYTNITWQNGSHTRDSLITRDNAYIINAEDKNGCATKDTIGVYFKYYPLADFGSDTTLCNNQPLVLYLYPQTNYFFTGVYKWQDGSILDKDTVTKAGTYWGTVSYDGCTVSDTIKVSYLTTANVSLGNDSTLCTGDSILLQSNIDNARYLWNTGDTTKSIYAKTSGTYFVRVSSSVCTLSDTINLTFNDRPSFYLGKDTTICEKETLVLSGSTGNYLWQDGSIGENYTVQSPGLYWLRLTQNGCSAADSILVAYKPLPAIELGNDTGFCAGRSLLLNVFDPGITAYIWQDQSKQATYLVKTAGDYFVSLIGNNGCVNSDTIHITTIQPPSFSLGADTVLCNSKILTFNVSLPGALYKWNDGTTQNTYTVNAPGVYSLTVTQSGCSISDTINIGYKPMPVVYLGNDTTLCNDNTIELNASNAGATYDWQDNNTQPVYKVTGPGDYYVKVFL
ncbi:MAG: hypothetical protein ABIN95_12790, partial [Mucilaginibacter sp.]